MLLLIGKWNMSHRIKLPCSVIASICLCLLVYLSVYTKKLAVRASLHSLRRSISELGWTKNTQFLNFKLLIRILGQNILETNQKKNQPKILMFGPPWGGQHFAIQLILKFFQESSKCTYLHINRRRILRWFQKCILLYHYLEYLTSYSSFSVKIGHFTPRVTNLALEMQ